MEHLRLVVSKVIICLCTRLRKLELTYNRLQICIVTVMFPSIYDCKLLNWILNQRTNGPENAHLRSAAYTNKHVWILWYWTPVQGQTKQLGHFLFSESSIFCPFANFSLQMTFQQFSQFKCIGNPRWPCHKLGLGHHRVMIYIYIGVL